MNQLFDKILNLMRYENGKLTFLGIIVFAVLTYLIMKIILLILFRVLDKSIKLKKSVHGITAREKTLIKTAKKIIKFVVYFIGVMIFLGLFGINSASILATAGIGSVAIGFGAQTLVKDVITGFFILMEDQFNVGELVKIGNFEGHVTEIGIRSTVLRAVSGDIHYIPNHKIQEVTNRSRLDQMAWVDVKVPNLQDIRNVDKMLNEALDKVNQNSKLLVEKAFVMGIYEMGDDSYTVRISAKSKAGDQWALQREIRKEVMKVFYDTDSTIYLPIFEVKGEK
ncbi:MAG: mechanosensitive ion channel family protein [Tissierellia bacterium]|nr:mechanosensitive ion channel family protein [Tissierellia bacterium]